MFLLHYERLISLFFSLSHSLSHPLSLSLSHPLSLSLSLSHTHTHTLSLSSPFSHPPSSPFSCWATHSSAHVCDLVAAVATPHTIPARLSCVRHHLSSQGLSHQVSAMLLMWMWCLEY